MSVVKKVLLLVLVSMCGLFLTYHHFSHIKDKHHENQGTSIAFSPGDSTNGPDVGTLAPDFKLSNTRGLMYPLSSFRGHPLTLAFFCGCDRCHIAARKIATMQREGKLRSLVAVIALDPVATLAFQRDTGLQGTLLIDTSDATAEKYQSDFCPRIWRLDSDGYVSYRSEVALEGNDLTKSLEDITHL